MTWEEIIENGNMKGMKAHQAFQEVVQKAILTSLSHEEAFNYIVFQGGTSLRFFYGNPRFSEDLDFVLRHEKNRYDLTKKIPKIQRFVSDVFPFLDNVITNIQKNDEYMQRLVFRTVSNVPEQKIRIHIELAYVPSYNNQPRILDYQPLNPAIRVEDQSEILADKITALGRRSYQKGRDIWDIYFLTVEKQISIPWNLVFQKAKDYGDKPQVFKERLLLASKQVRKKGPSILTNELSRFLPEPLHDQYSEIFDKISIRVADEVENVNRENVKRESAKGENNEG